MSYKIHFTCFALDEREEKSFMYLGIMINNLPNINFKHRSLRGD
jgi:hypothetical protein